MDAERLAAVALANQLIRSANGRPWRRSLYALPLACHDVPSVRMQQTDAQRDAAKARADAKRARRRARNMTLEYGRLYREVLRLGTRAPAEMCERVFGRWGAKLVMKRMAEVRP